MAGVFVGECFAVCTLQTPYTTVVCINTAIILDTKIYGVEWRIYLCKESASWLTVTQKQNKEERKEKSNKMMSLDRGREKEKERESTLAPWKKSLERDSMQHAAAVSRCVVGAWSSFRIGPPRLFIIRHPTISPWSPASLGVIIFAEKETTAGPCLDLPGWLVVGGGKCQVWFT